MHPSIMGIAVILAGLFAVAMAYWCGYRMGYRSGWGYGEKVGYLAAKEDDVVIGVHQKSPPPIKTTTGEDLIDYASGHSAGKLDAYREALKNLIEENYRLRSQKDDISALFYNAPKKLEKRGVK